MVHDSDTPRAGGAQDRAWMRRQLAEAIDAGERAMRSRSEARDNLGSAGTWGLFDLLGGGFIAGMIKRSKMEDASENLRSAQRDLEIFQDELQDVDVMMDIDLEVDGFLSFADLFMDSFFADALVQEKISRAKKQADEAIARTGSIVRALRNTYESL